MERYLSKDVPENRRRQKSAEFVEMFEGGDNRRSYKVGVEASACVKRLNPIGYSWSAGSK